MTIGGLFYYAIQHQAGPTVYPCTTTILAAREVGCVLTLWLVRGTSCTMQSLNSGQALDIFRAYCPTV